MGICAVSTERNHFSQHRSLLLKDADFDRNCYLQGIDLEAGGRNKKTWRTAPKSENVYLKLLVKVRACFGGFSLAREHASDAAVSTLSNTICSAGIECNGTLLREAES